MAIRLTQSQAATASGAFSQLDSARRMTRNHAHATGHEVADSFGGKATDRFAFDQPGTSHATVSFDPKHPILGTYNKDTLEHGYDLANSGSARVSIDYDNTHSLSTLFTPHTHDHYSVSPKGEHLTSRQGLDSTTVDVSPSGTWTVQARHLGFKSAPPLVLPNFDDRWQRMDMFMNTTFTPPSPVVGEG